MFRIDENQRVTNMNTINVVHTLHFVMPMEQPQFGFKATFRILGKSYKRLVEGRGSEFWLQVEEMQDDYFEAHKVYFLRFASTFAKHWSTFQLSYIYTIYFQKYLERLSNPEITEISRNIEQYYLERENKIILSAKEGIIPIPPPISLNPVTLGALSLASGAISFQAILKSKIGIPIGTFRKKLANEYECSVTKIRSLEFVVAGQQLLTIYLSNWENNTTPLRLLPADTVNVWNVVFRGNRCETTAITYFEVVKENTCM